MRALQMLPVIRPHVFLVCRVHLPYCFSRINSACSFFQRSKSSRYRWPSDCDAFRRLCCICASISSATSSGLGKNFWPGLMRNSARAFSTLASEYFAANRSKSHRYPSSDCSSSWLGYLCTICATNAPRCANSPAGKILRDCSDAVANTLSSDALIRSILHLRFRFPAAIVKPEMDFGALPLRFLYPGNHQRRRLGERAGFKFCEEADRIADFDLQRIASGNLRLFANKARVLHDGQALRDFVSVGCSLNRRRRGPRASACISLCLFFCLCLSLCLWRSKLLAVC